MPKRTRIPDHLLAAPFSVSAAIDLGISPERLRSKDLQQPLRGVRASAALPPVHPVVAYASRMPSHQFFCHITAAQIHGLPVPSRLLHDPTPHVGVITPARPPRSAGAIGHRFERAHVVDVRGYRVLSAVETWCSLAPHLSEDELIAMGDALTRRESPIATIGELRRAVADRRGCRGILKLSRAMNHVRSGTDSVKETELRLLLVRAGLPEPRVNLRVDNEFGAFVAYGDLVFDEWRVIAEYDGRQHAESTAQFARDITRLDDLASLDYRVVRIDKTLLALRLPAVTRVRNALLKAGWRG